MFVFDILIWNSWFLIDLMQTLNVGVWNSWIEFENLLKTY